MKNNKLFAYGILKRGYELDLAKYGAKFISEAHISNAALYGIGHRWSHESHPNEGREYHGVGLKLDVGPDRVAHGELWEIPDRLWDWLDSIEQNGRVYTRKVEVVNVPLPPDELQVGIAMTSAWVYEHNHIFSERDEIKGGRF